MNLLVRGGQSINFTCINMYFATSSLSLLVTEEMLFLPRMNRLNYHRKKAGLEREEWMNPAARTDLALCFIVEIDDNLFD